MCVFVAYDFGFTGEFALKVTRYYNYNLKFKSWIKLLDPARRARPRELGREEENSQKKKEKSPPRKQRFRQEWLQVWGYGYERKEGQLTT